MAIVTATALTSCASATVIRSTPSGAKVFLNGESVGTTPYTMVDTKIVGSTTSVRLEAPGYEPYSSVITRSEEFDVGACVGGFFVLVPWLWIMKYKPEHSYELAPRSGGMSPSNM